MKERKSCFDIILAEIEDRNRRKSNLIISGPQEKEERTVEHLTPHTLLGKLEKLQRRVHRLICGQT